MSRRLPVTTAGTMTGTPMPTNGLARACALVILLVAALNISSAANAAELTDPSILFPNRSGALAQAPVAGAPPAATVKESGKLIGYAFSTQSVLGSVGYSGRPFDVHVGLSLDGRITGAKLVAHQEPILVIGISSANLAAFVGSFQGIDIRGGVSAGKEPTEGQPDHVSGATISSTVIRHAVLRSARRVARSRGLLGAAGDMPTINRTHFEERTWPQLLDTAAVARRTIDRGQVAAALGKSTDDGKALFIDLYATLLTPPLIGRNLIGERRFKALTAEMAADDNAILIAANGLYSFKGRAWRRTGYFDRIQLVQGTTTVRFRREGYENLERLAVAGAPELREIGIFRIPAATGFEPARPWRLELIVVDSQDGQAVRTAVFGLGYALPAALMTKPARELTPESLEVWDPDLWLSIWRGRKLEIGALICLLSALSGILIFQDVLTRRRRVYQVTRFTFLSITLIFLGLLTGSQLSVINVVTFVHAVLEGFSWEGFLLDPLIFILWSFVALAMLFWGRGVFCGWLCPFGAMQELLNEAARRIGIKQIEIPWPLHERLWPIKYIAFLVILGLSFKSLAAAYQLAEIEPFKTTIVLTFRRAWPFAAYAIGLLVVGLFIERFFCRYLCPLGAALAIPAKLKLFDWLHRRPQCGRECRVCEKSCTVQAINPLGQITPNECIYCLQCQANYYDSNTCLPLMRRAARRGGATDEQSGGRIGD